MANRARAITKLLLKKNVIYFSAVLKEVVSNNWALILPKIGLAKVAMNNAIHLLSTM